MEYTINNLGNNKKYFFVRRKIYKTYTNFKFYNCSLDEMNLLLFNFSNDNFFLDVNINKILKRSIKFKINNNLFKLVYKNKTWQFTNKNMNTKTIIKKCLKHLSYYNQNIVGFDMVNIKDFDTNNFKKIVEDNNSSIIDSFKNNNLFFFKGVIDNNINYFNSNVCIICLDEFKNNTNDLINLSCKHRFHTQCLKNWIKHNNKCPICREKISIRNILEKNKINIFTCTSPRLRNEIPVLSFSPIENGKASTKNIKLEFNLSSVYKSLKLADDIFGIELCEPLNFEDAIALTLVNLSSYRAMRI
jgi:hypothetical protein